MPGPTSPRAVSAITAAPPASSSRQAAAGDRNHAATSKAVPISCGVTASMSALGVVEGSGAEYLDLGHLGLRGRRAEKVVHLSRLQELMVSTTTRQSSEVCPCA